MKIIEQTTRFINDVQIDLNYLLIQTFKNPLVIATREAQIYRILSWIDTNDIQFTVVGWWDLISKEYLCENGLIRSKWAEHDVVIFLDKERASDKETYQSLINIVTDAL